MRVEPRLTGLSGNEIYCMRLKGLTPSGVLIGNSIQSMGFLGGVRSACSGDAQELYCHMDAGYEPREFVFGNIAYSVGAVGGIAGTLKTLVRGEIKEFSDVFNETRHRALDRLVSHAKAARAKAVVGIRTSVMRFAGFHEMYMAGTAAAHPLLPAGFASLPATSDLTGEELWGMTQLGYIPLKLLISTSVFSLGAIGGIKAAFQSFVKGEIPDLTTLIYDAREQVFDRLKREAAALGAEEVVGIKTYILELGTSLVEIFSVGTAVRKLPGVGVQTASLPAQAIIRDKDTWLSGAGGFDPQSTRAGG